MRELVLLCLVSVGQANPAPQYSGATGDLSDGTLDTIKDIFGAGLGDGTDSYSGADTGKLNDGTDGGLGAVVQIVKNEDGYVAPDDYHQSEDQTKTTSNVDNVFEKCSDYTETQGYECVPYYQCDDGVIITDGGGLIDIRNGFGILSPEDSKCEGFLDVCCLDPDFSAPPPTPIKQYKPKCGQRHQNGLGVRIQGFKEGESQFGEWPHMCAVLSEEAVVVTDSGYAQQPEEEETVNLYQCGGSLIAPDTILTAAHCVDKFRQNPASLKIRCGEWDTQDENEPRPHQDRYVTDLDIHPAFNGKNLANDWALLYTAQPFQLQEHIDTICLPQPGEQFAGDTCFATGWGKDKFGAAGQYQVVLKEIDLPVVRHDQCEAKLRTTRLGRRFQLDDSFICAGGEDGKDTCKGDGGSPLVCPSKYDPYTYIQTGVVAWGIGCGEDNVPGVYASVSQAVCWIDLAMSCKAGSSSSYWGYGRECQHWWDTLHNTLNTQVQAMQDHTLTGRKKIKALSEGVQAQKYLEYLNNGCNVRWAEGGVDISQHARDESVSVTQDEFNSGLLTDTLVEQQSEQGSNNGASIVDPYPDPLDPHPVTDYPSPGPVY